MESYRFCGHTIVVEGSVVKVARLKQEFYYDVDNPPEFIEQLGKSGIKVDIFSFLQRFPESEPKYNYHMEWDNFAAIPISTYDNWYHHQIPKPTRRGIRKARELGLEVRWADVDDQLIRGITDIFNETPMRQGKPFWHYGKDFNAVKEAMARDSERSKFLGAYCGNELVGFVKLIYGRNYARTTQIISKIAHRRKYPNNALISKCVEICFEQGIPYLVYGQLDYGKVGTKTLADFKVNNGFQKIDIPRYFVALTSKGKLVLKLRLHHGILALVPASLVQMVLRLRGMWYLGRQGSSNKLGDDSPSSVGQVPSKRRA
jgi:Acetyltransferase (GNAT) domain